METIHETIAKEMERVEIDDLHQMLKKKSDVMKSQSIYLRAFLIQATAVYLLSKTSKKKLPNTPYTHRIKGCCQMALTICEAFGYIQLYNQVPKRAPLAYNFLCINTRTNHISVQARYGLLRYNGTPFPKSRSC